MKSYLYLLLAFAFLTACSQEFPRSQDALVLSADFDKKNDKVFSPKALELIRFSTGVERKALDLRDTDAILELANADTSWFSMQNDFSISFWVKTDHINRDTTIILSNADFRTLPMGIYGHRRTSHGITIYSYQGGWGMNIGNGELHYNYEPQANMQALSDNKWHQLAFTYDSKSYELRLFYDGINRAVLHIGDLKNHDFKSDLKMWIGGNNEQSPPYESFQGSMDRLNVWTRTLAPEAIRKEYEYFSKRQIDDPELDDAVFTVLNWNIWHGGTHYTKENDGFDGIERTIELIQEAKADVVLMQETYGAGSQISSSLGFYYYEASSSIGAVWGANLSVMSRFPIEDVFLLEEPANYGKNYAFNNAGAKIRLNGDKSVIVFTNWYNGRKPEDLEGALHAWTNLIENSDQLPLIFGGDYNSVSHLDDGLGESGHSKLMTGAGFTDAFRHLHPDTATFPGYSFHNTKRRIDYIYYKGNSLEALEVNPIVPNFKGKGELTPGYPSDHLGLVATFKIQ